MLTQLQLEGPELEPLLDRVRRELGPGARIVQAEKVRSGGVAGFFARERFELTVEVAAPRPAPPAAPAAQDWAARLLDSTSAAADLAAEREAATLAAQREAAAAAAAAAATQRLAAAAAARRAALAAAAAPPPPVTPTPAATPTAAAPPQSPAPPPAEAPPPPAVSVVELAERLIEPEPGLTVSTGSPSFAALLSRLSATAGRPADDAGTPTTEPVDGPTPAAVPAQRTAGPSTPAAASPAPPAPASPEPFTPAVFAPVSPATTDTPDRTGADVPVEDATLDAEQVEHGTLEDPPPASSAVAVRAAHAVVHARPVARVPYGEDDTPGTDLARLGLPAHLLPASYDEQLLSALRASLSRLPVAPAVTNRAGGVLAVVGPLALALDVARDLAAELALPVATSVAAASFGAPPADLPERQVLRDTAQAAARRAAWRRRSNLTVVAVDGVLTANGVASARAFLAALSPSATWGVVEATRKAQDVGSWTRALGGVHALALTDVEETADPAAVLELGIPVSRLGSRPATPRAWATLLTGRLAA